MLSRLGNYVLTCSFTDSLVHSPTHLLIHQLICSFTDLVVHLPTVGRVYKVFDLKNYNLLYSIADDNVQVIRL